MNETKKDGIEKVKPTYAPRIKSISPGSTTAEEKAFFQQEEQFDAMTANVVSSARQEPTEKVKPNWMAIRMSVKKGERTTTDLEECGCEQCRLALKFLEADE